ncbi:CCAAT/enhancer-binding protein gamma [Lampris incognitus]|uniref:CCAAT/enhancer-binding protein gamma n=1 Tax=Lampris incognitus TaxID=2546036 RepID=UPI0024B5955B|nr:CCAAT/enhancer-binding protein gamma [Lampris incognitus]
MSRQPKISPSEHNGVSVIQSQPQASSAPPSSSSAPPASSLPPAIGGLQQVPQLVPVNPSAGGGKAVPPSKMKKPPADKDSEEYRQRRERNNLAVKKSRMRSKQKAQDTQQRVNELKEENERLEAKIKLLSKELSVLKDLFLEHAHNLADNVQPPGGGEGTSPTSNNNNNNNNNSSSGNNMGQ